MKTRLLLAAAIALATGCTTIPADPARAAAREARLERYRAVGGFVIQTAISSAVSAAVGRAAGAPMGGFAK